MGRNAKSTREARHAKSKQAKPKAPRQPRQRATATSGPAQTEVAAVAVSTKSRGRQPIISYQKDGQCATITHKERIGTVLGSVAFTATKYAINPGLVTSFPWLSAVANRFESYRFKKLTFIYKTKTATTALGDVIMVTDYDAADNAPETSIQAESYQAYADCAPWQNQEMGASRQNLEKMPQRYTRDATPPSGTDIKTYDVGNFYICTENQASAALVGYLYVEYTVELFTPQLRNSDFYISGGGITGGGTMAASNILGTTASVSASTRGISVATDGTVTIANPGTYLVSISATGTVISGVGSTGAVGCTASSYQAFLVNAGATVASRTLVVVSTAFNATIKFDATATTITASTIGIASLPTSSLPLVDFMDPEESPCGNASCLKCYYTQRAKKLGVPIPQTLIDLKCGQY